jgi:DNA sulfur modification protein DndE
MKKILQITCFLFIFSLINTVSYAEQSTQNATAAFSKSLGDFSYTLALQAADWGLPIVVMYNLRYNDALKPDAKAKPN